MSERHVCTLEDPYFEAKHGHDAIHPSRTYQRDSTDVRGARRMAIYRCDICGTRFQDEPPEWAMAPLGVTPIPRPEPLKAEMPKLKVGRITVTLPAGMKQEAPAEDPHGRDPEEGSSRPYPWETADGGVIDPSRPLAAGHLVTEAEVVAPRPARARKPKTKER